jgi:phosphotransferase system enzyme I (PtsP)
MPASGIGPVKRLLLSADANLAGAALQPMLSSGVSSIRGELTSIAAEQGWAL